jgi:hypothetical protein
MIPKGNHALLLLEIADRALADARVGALADLLRLSSPASRRRRRPASIVPERAAIEK